MTTLTPEESQRYKRHLVLRDMGGQGQQKLKAARVLVIGGGVAGLSAALGLARQGYRVCPSSAQGTATATFTGSGASPLSRACFSALSTASLLLPCTSMAPLRTICGV